MAEIPHTNGNTPTAQKNVHILIIGAGLTGLVIAQGLRKFNASPEAANYHIRFTYAVYEREPHVFYRGGGYSLTLHWSLEHLDKVLPQEILDGIHDCLCNPHFVEEGGKSKFMYLNLRTAESVFEAPIPPVRMARVSRTKMISLLMKGIDVNFSKELSGIEWPTRDTVTALFSDGTSAEGNLLIGADGAKSKVRRILCGQKAVPTPVAVRALGIRCYYPVEKVKKVQDIDPNIIHGGDPENNTYWWFSFLDMPRPGSGSPMAQCYITLNWPYENEFLGRGHPTDVPTTKEERLEFQRMLAEKWAEPMREMVFDLPDDTEVHEIKLQEWTPEEDSWDNHSGTVTMIGDAAHAMTPCESQLSTITARNIPQL